MQRLPSEMLRCIGSCIGGRRDRTSFALTNRMLNAVVGPLLWECLPLPVNDIEKTGRCLKTLADCPDVACMVRALYIFDIRSLPPSIARPVFPYDDLCSSLAQAIHNMPLLQILHIQRPGFHSPVVIAALCAHKESQLTSLHLALHELCSTEDFSVLQDLSLTSGKLTQFTLDASSWSDYPAAYTDAIMRIITRSAHSIKTLELNVLGTKPVLRSPITFPKLEEVRVREPDPDGHFSHFAPEQVNILGLEYQLYYPESDGCKKLYSRLKLYTSVKCLQLELDYHTLDNELLDHLTDELLPYLPKITQLDFALQLSDGSQLRAAEGIQLVQSQLSKFKTRIKPSCYVTYMVNEELDTETGDQTYLDFTRWVLCPHGDRKEWDMQVSWYRLTDAATDDTVEFFDRLDVLKDHD